MMLDVASFSLEFSTLKATPNEHVDKYIIEFLAHCPNPEAVGIYSIHLYERKTTVIDDSIQTKKHKKNQVRTTV